jgi:hypothetical protein
MLALELFGEHLKLEALALILEAQLPDLIFELVTLPAAARDIVRNLRNGKPDRLALPAELFQLPIKLLAAPVEVSNGHAPVEEHTLIDGRSELFDLCLKGRLAFGERAKYSLDLSFVRG